MKQRTWQIGMAAFAFACVGAYAGFRAQPHLWGMYIQLPGIAAGLFAGFAVGSRSVVATRLLVFAVTVFLNGACYFWCYRLLVQIFRRLQRPRPGEAK